MKPWPKIISTRLHSGSPLLASFARCLLFVMVLAPCTSAQFVSRQDKGEQNIRLGFGIGFTALGYGGSSSPALQGSYGIEGYRGPSLFVSVEFDPLPWLTVGGYIKAQWPDATCFSGSCSASFYLTEASGVMLAAVPRLGLRLYEADCGLSISMGLGFGLSSTVRGRSEETTLHLGYVAHFDIGLSVPVATRWEQSFGCLRVGRF
jgi:hypothetical protein